MTSILAALLALGPQSLAPTSNHINFDDLFPRKPYMGKVAGNLNWSRDGRYLLYTWNPYSERVNDLWMYDAKSEKSSRLTSMEMMRPFDRDIPKAMVRYERERKEEEDMLKMSDSDYRDYLQKKREEREKRGEPEASYGGFGDINWAHKKSEFLFTYKGDIYRWVVGEKSPSRLTKTSDGEFTPRYTKDDSGFYFMRGQGLYRMTFGSPMVEQLNPKLPNGLAFANFWIAPDEKKAVVLGTKDLPGTRMVDWISYRERFAQAQKTPRDVADDPFRNESHLFWVDLDDRPENKDYKADPTEFFAYKGGDDLVVTSIDEKPWKKDSSEFVYSVYSRNTKDLSFRTMTAGAKEAKVVYKTKQEGEENSASYVSPFWLDDGRVVGMLETSGYRHAWLIDPKTEGATQLTKGDFETIPISATADGKAILVKSSKENPARQQIYRVPLDSGEYERITPGEGNYQNPVVSEDGSHMAVGFASWKSPMETYVLDAKPKAGQIQLTKSHNEAFATKYNKLQPTLFDFPNRHGQAVHGYVMTPPDMKPGEKRPLFMYVYGGPLGFGNSVEDGAFNSTAYAFAMYLTLELGYVTATVDPRGSSGYGAVFGKANFNQPGVPQTEDLTDAVKYLSGLYPIDSERVGINGWSFGGFQTQMCMYTAPDVFTLGIAGAGPTEWQNYNNWYTGNTITRSPMGDPKPADQFSLTKLAKNLKSPLMLLHGMEDTNVLFQDTVKVYQQLLRAGKGPLVELALDPTGGHGMGGDMSNRDRHLIYLAFIKKHWERK